MSRRDGCSDVVRLVRGVRGRLDMRMELVVRFDYGSIVPWVVRQDDGRLQFTAGPDRLLLDTTAAMRGEDFRTVAAFTVNAGEEVSFVLTWSQSFRATPLRLDAAKALEQVEAFWSAWSEKFDRSRPWADLELRSLITLKALAHWETGGLVAAGTTSLPEKVGGPRNWDYRYCWLRDAAFTLNALVGAGFVDEATAWRQWLLRAAAGAPSSHWRHAVASSTNPAPTSLEREGRVAQPAISVVPVARPTDLLGQRGRAGRHEPSVSQWASAFKVMSVTQLEIGPRSRTIEFLRPCRPERFDLFEGLRRIQTKRCRAKGLRPG